MGGHGEAEGGHNKFEMKILRLTILQYTAILENIFTILNLGSVKSNMKKREG